MRLKYVDQIRCLLSHIGTEFVLVRGISYRYIYIKIGPPNDVCHTISGPAAKKPCSFPFRYNGVTYDKCTYDSADGNIPWCSTLVDDNQNHVPGGGHYGDCGPNCPLPGKSMSNNKSM